MITLSAQDLSNYGALQSPSTLTFLGKVFVRGQSFSLTMREQAAKMAEKSLQKGRPCLLVESDTETTLWVEMQNHTPALQNPSIRTQDISPPVPEAKSFEQSASLTYRGHSVTPPPPLSSLSKKSSNLSAATAGSESDDSRSPKTLTMSYRGQTFEVPVTDPAFDLSRTVKTPEPSDSFEDPSDERSPSSPAPKRSAAPKRKIQYRGQWIEVD